MSTQQKREYKQGDLLFREGDRGDYVYFIEDGTVEIITGLDTETETVIKTASKGEMLGEMAVLEDRPRSASAKIKTSATIIQLDRASFLARITKDPSAAMRTMKTLSNRLRILVHDTEGDHSPKGIDEIETESADTQIQANDNLHSLSETNFERKTLLAALSLCIILLGSIFGATLIEVETTVSAHARVVPATANLTIEADTDGTLEDVLIQEGDNVQKGQIIARMSFTRIDAEIKSMSAELEVASARLQRLEKEREILSQAEAPDIEAIYQDISDNVLRARLTRRASQITVYDHDLKIFEANLKHRQSERKMLDTEYDIAKKQSGMMSADKVRSGVISQMDSLDSQSALVEVERRVLAKDAEITDLEGQIEKTKVEKLAFIAEWSSELEKQIEQDIASVTTLTTRLDRLKVDRDAHFIKSPIDGKVLELLASREGTFLSKGHPIAEITRSNQTLIVEAEVMPRDVEQIRTGLPVSFKLDSLPFQRYGDIKGTLSRVDDDAIASRRPGINDEFFMVRVDLEGTAPKMAPEAFELRRGMTGKADMITGTRSILSYLLDPIMGAMKTAFRESS